MAIQFLNNPKVGDNVKIEIGDSSDLQIYHDGNNSKITEGGTGGLYIGSNLLGIQNGSHNETMATFTADGSVDLYHNNVKKFETTSSGATLSGDLLLEESSTPTLTLKDTTNNLVARFRAANSYAYITVDHADTVASSRLVFQVDNATSLYLDHQSNAVFENGNVGIGETSIDARLHITKASAGLVNQKFESAGSAAWRLGIPASQTYFAFDNANDNLSAPKLVINNSGFVGIGSTNPIAPLEVKSSEQNHLTLYRTTNTTEGIAGNINFDGNDSDSNQQTYAKISSFTDDPTAGSIAGKLSFSIAKGGDGMTSAMTIQKDAQVSLNQYGSGSYTGTAAYTLQVDSAGNIIEGSTTGGGTVTGSGAATRVAFWSGTTALSSDANLYWDNTNDRLGIGTTTPDYELDVAGEIGLDSYLRHNGDTNTFFGFSGNDEIKFRTSGSDRIFINSSGNVGIGTTSPSDGDLSINAPRLHVAIPATSGTFNLAARFQSTTTDADNTGTSILINSSNDRGLLIQAGRKDGDREVAYFNVISSGATVTPMLTMGKFGSSYNVGIGTTTPDSKLHVVANDSTMAQFASSGSLANDKVLQIQSGGDRVVLDFKTNSTGAAAALAFESGNTERMRIDSSGNVGIGTTSPADRLDVTDGNAKMVFGTASSDRPWLYFQHNAVPVDGEEIGILDFRGYNSASQDTRYVVLTAKAEDVTDGTEDGSLTFQTMKAGTSAQTLTLRSGNVGIGTTTPDELLDVENGNIRLKSNSDGSTGILRIYDSAGVESGQLYPVAGDLRIFSNNDILFNQAGNVGIGTTAPGQKLVASTSNESLFDVLGLYNTVTGTSALNKGAAIRIGQTTDGSYSTKIATIFEGQNPSYLQPALAFFTMHNSYLKGSEVERMRIKSTGQVQFNAYGQEDFTGTAAYLLAVEADGDVIEVGPSDLPGGPYLPLSGGTMTLSSSPLILPGEESNAFKIAFTGASASSGLSTVDQSGAGLYIGANSRVNNSGVVITNNTLLPGSGIYFDGWSNDDMRFFTGATGNPSVKMIIESGGNVGIGTTNPESKLQVGGTSTSDGSINIGGIYGVYNWTRSYVASNTLIPAILNQAGNALANGGAYRVTAHISGTGTDQSSRAVFWNQNGTWHCNVTAQSGDTSNQIQFLISSSVPSVKTYHASNYTIRVWHERIELAEESGTDNTRHYFGADSYMSQMGNDISMAGPLNGTQGNSGSVGIGTTSPNTKLEVISAIPSGNRTVPLDILTITGEGPSVLPYTGSGGAIVFKNTTYNYGLLKSARIRSYVDADSASNRGAGLVFEVTNSNQTYNPSLFLKYNGNVGIGTTSPDRILHIESDTTAAIQLENTSEADSFIDFKNPSRTFRVGYDDSTDLFKIAVTNFNDNSLVVNSSGNVGIGETTPLVPLHISRDSASGENIALLLDNNNTTAGNEIGILFRSAAGSTNTDFEIFGKANGANDMDLVFQSDGSSERMRITSTGDVGIGTTSPDSKLEVENNQNSGFYSVFVKNPNAGGNAFVSKKWLNNDAGFGEIWRNSSTRSSAGQAANSFNLYNSNDINIWSGNSHTMALVGNNVGIGTTAPENRLHLGPNSGNVKLALEWSDSNTATSGEAYSTIYTSGQGGSYPFSGRGNLILQPRNTDANGAGDLVVMTGATATPKLTVQATGNVGIGTTAPAYKLDVSGGAIAIRGHAPGNSLRFDSTDGTTSTSRNALYVDTSNVFQIGNTNYTRNNITGNTTFTGNVGIGTTLPASPLHVNTGTGTNTANTVIIDRPASSDYSGISFATAGTVDWSIGHNSAGNFEVFENGSNATTRLTIETGGNVGIGTDSPDAKLHVVSTGEIARFQDTSATANPFISFFQTTTRRGYLQFVDSGDMMTLTSEYGGIKFMTGTGGTETEKMVIQSDGDVGIGVTNPVNKLQVGGKIYSSTDIQAASQVQAATYKWSATTTPLEQSGALTSSSPANPPDFTPDGYIEIKVQTTVYLIPIFEKGT